MQIHYDRRLLAAARCATQEAYLEWLLAQPVAALRLEARSWNVLENLGIWTLGDLAGTPASVLLAYPGLGADSVREIRAKVRRVLATGELPEEAAEREVEIETGLARVRGKWSPQEERGRRVTRCGAHVEGRASLPATRWNNRIHG